MAIIYGIFSFLWISFSDQILYYFVKDAELLTRIQTIKGWLFITVTSVIVYALLLRELRKEFVAEQGFRESQEKYRIMAELTGQMVYDHDLKENRIHWSGSINELTGYKPHEFSEVDQHAWLEMIHEDDRERVTELYGSAREKAAAYKLEYRLKQKDGTIIHVEDSGNFVQDDEGKACRLLGNMKNISERKLIESASRQKQKMEAIGNLAGGIAHDFNNILGAIIGYADLAREDVKPGSTVHNNLGKLLEASNRAKNLVKQILAFSRQAEPELILFQPANVVKEAVKMLRSTLPATIEIILDIDPRAGLINADPTHINQILMNLSTNAFHAMEDSGGKLKISLAEIESGDKQQYYTGDASVGRLIRLSVSDTGTGIPDEVKEKMFTPYFTTKETGKGTGMGLAIVHGIVQSYNGFLSVESSLGKGTTVDVYLPVAEGQAGKEEADDTPVPHGRETILYVDDESILTEMGALQLAKLGYQVTTSNNSFEALRMFEESPKQFDLVITDQTMPELTGAELATRMLRIRPDMPIILCTGYSTLMTEQKAKEIGVRAFVLKPLARKDIAKLIRRVLEQDSRIPLPYSTHRTHNDLLYKEETHLRHQ